MEIQTPANVPLPPPPDQVSQNHGPGEATTHGDPALTQKIERASASAVDQHLSDPETRRKRGQRGPDSKPRKPRGLSLGPLDDGAAGVPLAEAPPAPLYPFLDPPAAFDEETARTLVEIGVGLLNDGAAAIVRAVAKKETGDDALADAAAAEVRMSEKIEHTIKTGAVQCAKKYAVRLDYAPEIMLGGGLVIWAGQVSLSVKALKAKGAEVRAREKKAA